MICPSCRHNNIEGVDRCESCMKPLRDLDVPRADATFGLVRSVMEDDLGELERTTFVTVRPGDLASEVMRRMRESNTGCALVVEETGELTGIFTARDVLFKLAGEAQAGIEETSVSELMTQNPETLEDTDSIAAALNKIAIGRLRYVPVLAKDDSYTVISVKNVLQYIAQKEY